MAESEPRELVQQHATSKPARTASRKAEVKSQDAHCQATRTGGSANFWFPGNFPPSGPFAIGSSNRSVAGSRSTAGRTARTSDEDRPTGQRARTDAGHPPPAVGDRAPRTRENSLSRPMAGVVPAWLPGPSPPWHAARTRRKPTPRHPTTGVPGPDGPNHRPFAGRFSGGCPNRVAAGGGPGPSDLAAPIYAFRGPKGACCGPKNAGRSPANALGRLGPHA